MHFYLLRNSWNHEVKKRLSLQMMLESFLSIRVYCRPQSCILSLVIGCSTPRQKSFSNEGNVQNPQNRQRSSPTKAVRGRQTVPTAGRDKIPAKKNQKTGSGKSAIRNAKGSLQCQCFGLSLRGYCRIMAAHSKLRKHNDLQVNTADNR